MGHRREEESGRDYRKRRDIEELASKRSMIAETKRLYPDEIKHMKIDSLWTLFGKEFLDYEKEQDSIGRKVISKNLQIIKEKLFTEIIKREKDYSEFSEYFEEIKKTMDPQKFEEFYKQEVKSEVPPLGNPLIDEMYNLLNGIEKNKVEDKKGAMLQIDFHLKLIHEIFGKQFPSKRLALHFERVLKAREKLSGK